MMYKKKYLPTWKEKSNNIPGYGEEQLGPESLLKNNNSSGGGQYDLGTFTITATGNISITGVGFKPKLVKFTVGSSSGNTGEAGIGSMTETKQQCLNVGNSAIITSNCIYYGSSTAVKVRAVYVSMDSDGFTINCSYFVNNSYVLYECFG